MEAVRAYAKIKPSTDETHAANLNAATEAALTKQELADTINVIIEELVRQRYQLPASSPRNRKALAVRSEVNDRYFKTLIQSDTLHGDKHAQSAPVFGLAVFDQEATRPVITQAYSISSVALSTVIRILSRDKFYRMTSFAQKYDRLPGPAHTEFLTRPDDVFRNATYARHHGFRVRTHADQTLDINAICCRLATKYSCHPCRSIRCSRPMKKVHAWLPS